MMGVVWREGTAAADGDPTKASYSPYAFLIFNAIARRSLVRLGRWWMSGIIQHPDSALAAYYSCNLVTICLVRHKHTISNACRAWAGQSGTGRTGYRAR